MVSVVFIFFPNISLFGNVTLTKFSYIRGLGMVRPGHELIKADVRWGTVVGTNTTINLRVNGDVGGLVNRRIRGGKIVIDATNQ